MSREEQIEKRRREQMKALAAGCTLWQRLRFWWSRRQGRKWRRQLEKQFPGGQD